MQTSNSISEDEFGPLFKKIIAAFARNEADAIFLATKAGVFYGAVNHLPIDRLSLAIDRVISSSKWFPTPSDIIEAAGWHDAKYDAWVDNVR